VNDRHTSAGSTDAGARGQRTFFMPLDPGLDPTGTRSQAGTPSGSTHARRPHRVLPLILAAENRPA